MLGVVGDSAAGKTTVTRGLVRVLGEDNVAHICTDDYHRYDRKQRAELGITPRRDCSRRGYTTDEVLAELDRREADSETFIRRHADMLVSFLPQTGEQSDGR